MARLARTTIINHPHHVVQRAKGDQPVFDCKDDYLRYLSWIHEYFARYDVEVWAYCLMPNHVHIICVPLKDGGLARALNSVHMRYAQFHNAKNAIHGHLWRPRFMSCLLDEDSAWEEVRFVENNPLRAGFVTRAEDYPWSSASAHVAGRSDGLIAVNCSFVKSIGNWPEFLAVQGNEMLLRRTRAQLKTGRPAGNPDFVQKIEDIIGRKLVTRPRGRPRKAASNA
jgi:putative transposase